MPDWRSDPTKGDTKATIWRPSVPGDPKTGSGHQTPKNPGPIASPAQYVTLYAEDFYNSSQNATIHALAGDQPPTLSGGTANQTTVARPLRRGLTVFTGYDPVSLDVSLRFMRFAGGPGGRIYDDDDHCRLNEHDLQKLEWMAGYDVGQGPPPLIWLSTSDRNGNTNPLIPLLYQAFAGDVPKNIGGQNGILDVYLGSAFGVGTGPPWVVSSCTWDTAPQRNANGWRIRQDVQLTFSSYSAPGPGASSTSRNNPKDKNKGKYFTATAAYDTPLKIAQRVGARSPGGLARAIIRDPKNYIHPKHGDASQRWRSIKTKIRPGTRVWIPATYAG